MTHAERLIRTETSYVHNQAALERYQKKGPERFEFLNAKDSRTCPICAKRNGDVVPLEAGEPGKNMPPMHPWCRCTVLPVVEEERLLGDASQKVDDKTREMAYNKNGNFIST